MTRANTAESYRERVLRAQMYLQNHLSDAVDLDQLASVACFSPYHFHRIFRGMTGESVMEHVRRLRLERAAQRLKSSDRPVTELAFEAGYESLEAFTRAFRARFGEPPSSFRGNRAGVGAAPVALACQERPIEVRIEVIAPMRVAFLRHVGPYNEVGSAWMKLMSWAGMRGLFGPHTRAIGILHDDPDITAPERLRYDAAVTIVSDLKPEGDIGMMDLTGGEYAITRHRGSYDQISSTYARLCGEWLPESGKELASAPALEIYLNNPQMAKPEDLLTDACLPLVP
jgi:AraC family transcriptional regulator